mmetsp:Transcript_4247/g.9416  ORF Transcript_4247/g.9416 Transcript_4247/m.9416 type:complete len:415 (+) Transcript_4247:479-1723(+)
MTRRGHRRFYTQEITDWDQNIMRFYLPIESRLDAFVVWNLTIIVVVRSPRRRHPRAPLFYDDGRRQVPPVGYDDVVRDRPHHEVVPAELPGPVGETVDPEALDGRPRRRRPQDLVAPEGPPPGRRPALARPHLPPLGEHHVARYRPPQTGRQQVPHVVRLAPEVPEGEPLPEVEPHVAQLPRPDPRPARVALLGLVEPHPEALVGPPRLVARPPRPPHPPPVPELRLPPYPADLLPQRVRPRRGAADGQGASDGVDVLPRRGREPQDQGQAVVPEERDGRLGEAVVRQELPHGLHGGVDRRSPQPRPGGAGGDADDRRLLDGVQPRRAVPVVPDLEVRRRQVRVGRRTPDVQHEGDALAPQADGVRRRRRTGGPAFVLVVLVSQDDVVGKDGEQGLELVLLCPLTVLRRHGRSI